MTIRILVNGAKGRMGQATVQAILADPALELVGQTNRGDNLEAALKQLKPQVAIDFTSAEVAFENASQIIDAGVHPIIGTSGLLSDQIKTLQKKAAEKKLGGLIAPNFSLGAVLIMQYAKQAAAFFPEVEIVEKHHLGKKDAPSATSIRTAEFIAEGRKEVSKLPAERELFPGARGCKYLDVPIHSVRLHGLYADQDVIFGGMGETITLSHTTFDRSCFMPGVLLACKKVTELKELLYGLEKILFS